MHAVISPECRTRGRRSSRLLLKANKRLNTAYMLTLKETFGQLWDYPTKVFPHRARIIKRDWRLRRWKLATAQALRGSLLR